MKKNRIRLGAASLLLTPALLLGNPGRAEATPREPHCVHPERGDLNEFLGTHRRIITGFCTEAFVGERWIVPALWTTNTTHEVIPEGYTPSRPTPMEDFNAKFVSVRYVVDAGTRHERTYRFRAAQSLHTGFTVPGTDLPMSFVHAELPPLPAGTHTVDILWTVSADHWDGFGADPSANRFPAGETHCSHIEFVVRRGNGR